LHCLEVLVIRHGIVPMTHLRLHLRLIMRVQIRLHCIIDCTVA